MAEQIGKALARVPVEATGSAVPQTVDWTEVDLSILRDPPERPDDSQLAALEHIASLPVPVLPAATEQEFAEAMRVLRLLPTRADDDLTGELRLRLYEQHFGRYSAKALQFLVSEATLTCRFFPSPAECKAILDRFTRRDRPARAVVLASRLARKGREWRYDDLFRRFRIGQVSQEEVDRLPPRWRDHAVTQGYVWGDSYRLRVDPLVGGERQEGESPSADLNQPPGDGEKAPAPPERTMP